MPSATVLDRIESRVKSEKEAAVLRFHQYVVDIANGTEPTEAEITETLRLSEKSLAELKAGVSAILNRRAMKAQADRQPMLRQQINELQEEMDAKAAELADICNRINGEILALRQQQSELATEEQKCISAHSRLRQTADPDLLDQIGKLGKQKEAIRVRRGDRVLDVRRFQNRVAELSAEVNNRYRGGESRRLFEQQLEQAQRELTACEEALESDDNRAAEICREVAAIEQRLADVI